MCVCVCKCIYFYARVCIYVFIYALATTIWDCNVPEALPSNGRFPLYGETTISWGRGPSWYKAQSGGPSGVNALRWTRPGRGKRLFRNLPLAAGHPLTRIRVFNSACEENEEEKRMWSKEGCRNENGGDRTRTANWLDRHVFVIEWSARIKIYVTGDIYSETITLVWKLLTQR